MDEEQMDKLIETYSPYLIAGDGGLDTRLLRLLCQEIERETRHRAVTAIFAVANAVNAKEDVREMLRA